MIPGLKERRPIEIPIYGGGVINIIIPDTYYSMEEADKICKQLRLNGYHCGIIYRYVHRINGKGYIGQTMYPSNRYKNHLRNANSQSPDGVWAKMIKRYGIDCFDYYILDIKSDRNERHLHDLLDESEKYYIQWYHTSVKEWGYNIADGGWKLPSKSKTEKAVDMFDLNGNYIRTYPSLAKASAEFGFTGATIRQVCNHVHHTAGGYLWAWHGQLPVLPPDNRVYAYNNDGVFLKEYANEFVASMTLGLKNGNIFQALRDKYRLAYGMYWRTYKTDCIPLSDFPKAVYAYDLNGNFVRGFINLSKAKDFIGDKASSSISHAIIRKTAHRGYLWRTKYAEHIDPADGRFINKAAVIAIFPDKTTKRYEMIKDAATEIGMHPSGIHRSIKLGVKTAKGIKFIRVNEQT